MLQAFPPLAAVCAHALCRRRRLYQRGRASRSHGARHARRSDTVGPDL